MTRKLFQWSTIEVFAKWIWRGVFQEKVPLWLHILTLILTVVVTITITPKLNAEFERQKIRTAFVIDGLNSINTLTGDLAVNITSYNYCEMNRPGKCDSEIRSAQSAIVRLQWKAVQLKAILRDKADVVAINQFQISLEKVAVTLNGPNTSAKAENLDLQIAAFGRASVGLVRRVARQAGIDTPAT